MEIEDRIANTELVVSAGRGRSDSVIIPRLARRYSAMWRFYEGVHSNGESSHCIGLSAALMNGMET